MKSRDSNSVRQIELSMAKITSLLNNIAVQAALIIVGLSAASLVLSIYLYRQSMREIALTEVQNKATIFLSAMETSVRRLVMEKNTESLVDMLQERAEYLKDNLNFAVVGVIVRDADLTVLEHKVRRADGTIAAPQQAGNTDPGHIPKDFQHVMESKQPLVKELIKTLKMVEGQPEAQVIEVYYPVMKRKQGDVMAVIKLVISVDSTFELIKDQYQEFTRRVVFGFSLAAVLLVLGILFFVRRRIIAPILSINEGAQRVASGDLTTRLAPTGSNELSNLMQAFNEMVNGLRHRDQMRRSLAVAKEVQQNLLPHEAPAIAGLDIAGVSIYCDETGGDYFDYIVSADAADNKVSVVVGDVSGHGISSALLMATTRAFLRQRAALPGSPAEIISDVNAQFSHDVADSGSFMSMFYLSIDTDSQTLDWVRAGHDPAIRYDPGSEVIDELKGAGVALGVDADFQYRENGRVPFAEGQIILLGTDGIWEARNGRGDMFGKESIYRIIKENSDQDAAAILAGITGALADFQQGAAAEDDVTLVVVKMVPRS